MELYSVFITGANRGIGLEFVRQFVRLPNPPKYVFATYRSRTGIQALKAIRDESKKTRVIPIQMDVTKKNEVEAAKEIADDLVGDRGLTLLINNAAVAADQSFPQITEENLLYHFKTNTIGPVMVMQEFLPLLQRSASVRDNNDSSMGVNRAMVLNISALLASMTHMNQLIDVASWRCPGYNISKTALNMAGRVIAANVKNQGILVVNMCPGWVKTDMGSEIAELNVDESVLAMMNTLPTLNDTHHGEFMDRNGKIYEF